MRRQVERKLQLISSILIILSFILKAMHEALFLYLLLKNF